MMTSRLLLRVSKTRNKWCRLNSPASLLALTIEHPLRHSSVLTKIFWLVNCKLSIGARPTPVVPAHQFSAHSTPTVWALLPFRIHHRLLWRAFRGQHQCRASARSNTRNWIWHHPLRHVGLAVNSQANRKSHQEAQDNLREQWPAKRCRVYARPQQEL